MEEELSAEVSFKGADGRIYAAAIKDIALHLNYHSIHHRAQVLRIVREQGIKADVRKKRQCFVDSDAADTNLQ